MRIFPKEKGGMMRVIWLTCGLVWTINLYILCTIIANPEVTVYTPPETATQVKNIKGKWPRYVYIAERLLTSCRYLQVTWPKQYANIPAIRDVIYEIGDRNVRRAEDSTPLCAQTFYEFRPPLVVVYPLSWQSVGCYNKKVSLVIAHELLHVIRLPNHKQWKTPAEQDEMLRTDAIERTIYECAGEASIRGWELE